MQASPDFDGFARAYGAKQPVLVWTSLVADLETPVSVMLKLADGRMTARFVDLPEGDPDREHRYSERLACPNGHPLAFDELGPVPVPPRQR